MSAGRFGADMRHFFECWFIVMFVLGCAGCAPDFPGQSVCTVHVVRAVSASTGEFGAGTSIALSETRFLTCLHVTDVPEVVLTVDGVPARIDRNGQGGQGVNDPVWGAYQRDWAILETEAPVAHVTVPEFWHGETMASPMTAHCLGFGFRSRGEAVESHFREIRARIVRMDKAPECLFFLIPERTDLHGLSGGPVVIWDKRDHKWKVAGILIGTAEAEDKFWGRQVDLAAARFTEGAMVKSEGAE